MENGTVFENIYFVFTVLSGLCIYIIIVSRNTKDLYDEILKTIYEELEHIYLNYSVYLQSKAHQDAITNMHIRKLRRIHSSIANDIIANNLLNFFSGCICVVSVVLLIISIIIVILPKMFKDLSLGFYITSIPICVIFVNIILALINYLFERKMKTMKSKYNLENY